MIGLSDIGVRAAAHAVHGFVVAERERMRGAAGMSSGAAFRLGALEVARNILHDLAQADINRKSEWEGRDGKDREIAALRSALRAAAVTFAEVRAVTLRDGHLPAIERMRSIAWRGAQAVREIIGETASGMAR